MLPNSHPIRKAKCVYLKDGCLDCHYFRPSLRKKHGEYPFLFTEKDSYNQEKSYFFKS